MNDSSLRMREEADAVLSEFGATMYICQAFESSLCFLHALMSEEQNKGSFSASWDFHSPKTLGQMLGALRQRIDIPSELDAYFGEAVTLRNKIVHGFLTSNATRLYDPKGRIELVKELEEMKQQIKKRDIVVNKLIDELLKKYGLSNQWAKENAEKYWREVNFENVAESSKPH